MPAAGLGLSLTRDKAQFGAPFFKPKRLNQNSKGGQLGINQGQPCQLPCPAPAPSETKAGRLRTQKASRSLSERGKCK